MSSQSPFGGVDARALPTGGYHIQLFSGGAHNPADATTYFVGAIPFQPQTVATSLNRLYVPRSGFLRWYAIHTGVSTILGSAETGSVSLRVNGVTDYLLSSVLMWDAGIQRVWSDIDPGVVPLAKNDFFELMIVTPTWATNPTGVVYWAQLWIEP